MTYSTLADVNATGDLSEVFLYVNDVTNGAAMPMMLFGFFMIVLLGGAFAQLRFRGTMRLDYSFATAGFTTFGLAVLMSVGNGLLAPTYLVISLGIAILGAIWLYAARDEE